MAALLKLVIGYQGDQAFGEFLRILALVFLMKRQHVEKSLEIFKRDYFPELKYFQLRNQFLLNSLGQYSKKSQIDHIRNRRINLAVLDPKINFLNIIN